MFFRINIELRFIKFHDNGTDTTKDDKSNTEGDDKVIAKTMKHQNT